MEVFQHYVEHQDGYRVINRGGGRVGFAKESEVQGFFGLLLQGSWFDVNREPNNGRGPVDFKISMGAVDKTLIEFKLAKSSSLKRNVENQVAIYEKANRTNTSVLVIIAYTGAEMARAQMWYTTWARCPARWRNPSPSSTRARTTSHRPRPFDLRVVPGSGK